MDIKEKAIEYAKGRELTVLEQALADAYLEGYNAALADIEKNEKIEYVDLGLPSGTLWSNHYMSDENKKWIVYSEARNYILPSKSQWDELISETQQTMNKGIIYFQGANGNKFALPANLPNNIASFWLNSETDDKKQAKYIRLDLSRYTIDPKVLSQFVGACCGVLAVKYK